MREQVREIVAAAVRTLYADESLAISVERTKREEHGDFMTNVALALAPRLGQKPREVAERLRGQIGAHPLLASVEVAGPGFLNFRLAPSAWQSAFAAVLQAGAAWGKGAPQSLKVLLEYPSPNPTGPLHVGHGRIAALGDSLARLLRRAGYQVTTECYINDWGTKIRNFALSIRARAMGEKPPAEGYQGTYIEPIAQAALRAQIPLDDLEKLGNFGIDAMLSDILRVLKKFRVELDQITRERDLYTQEKVARTLDRLRGAGWLEDRDGAVWFRSTDLAEDDKNRVVVRRTGEPTYFAADLAYHQDKLDRGFRHLINIFGADHHGHLERMRGGIRALGYNPECFEVLIVQIVSLLRDGRKVPMDKSSGDFVTLEEVVDEVGADAARFFFLMRRHDTPLDFDLELAKRRTLDNPVYYVQYAHARCSGLLRRAAELGFGVPSYSPELGARLPLAEELAMIRTLVGFPEVVAEAASAREPHRIVYYAQEIAQAFQSYYTRLQKVHNDPILPQRRHREGDWQTSWDRQKTGARLLWISAIRTTLRSALDLVGVDAPDEMSRASTDFPRLAPEEDD